MPDISLTDLAKLGGSLTVSGFTLLALVALIKGWVSPKYVVDDLRAQLKEAKEQIARLTGHADTSTSLAAGATAVNEEQGRLYADLVDKRIELLERRIEQELAGDRSDRDQRDQRDERARSDRAGRPERRQRDWRDER
jgi:hypothetical protein